MNLLKFNDVMIIYKGINKRGRFWGTISIWFYFDRYQSDFFKFNSIIWISLDMKLDKFHEDYLAINFRSSYILFLI